MRRIAIFFALVVAAVMVLSTLMAPDADARKRNRLNTVNCPTFDGTSGTICVGTNGRDFLIGNREANVILGREGNDIYVSRGSNQDANGTPDFLIDSSTSSNDYYYFGDTPNIGEVIIDDEGGDSDTLDLRAYSTSDIVRLDSRDLGGDPDELDLLVEFRNGGKLVVLDYYGSDDSETGSGFIETIIFSDETFSDQASVESLGSQETTAADEGTVPNQ